MVSDPLERDGVDLRHQLTQFPLDRDPVTRPGSTSGSDFQQGPGEVENWFKFHSKLNIKLLKPAIDPSGRCRTGRFVNISDDDYGTFIVKAGSYRPANTTRSASDDASLITQSLHYVLEVRSSSRRIALRMRD